MQPRREWPDHSDDDRSVAQRTAKALLLLPVYVAFCLFWPMRLRDFAEWANAGMIVFGMVVWIILGAGAAELARFLLR